MAGISQGFRSAIRGGPCPATIPTGGGLRRPDPADQPRRPDCLRPIAGTDAPPRWPTGNLANWDDHPTRFLTRLHASPSGKLPAAVPGGRSEPGGRTITARSASGRSLAVAVSANKKPVRGGPVCGGNPRAGGGECGTCGGKPRGGGRCLPGGKALLAPRAFVWGSAPEMNDIPAGCSRRAPASGCRPRKTPSGRKSFRCNGIFSARAPAAAAPVSLSARHAKSRHRPLTASRPVTTIPHDHRDRRSDPPL